MNIKYIIYTILSLIVFCFACNSGKTSSQTTETTQTVMETPVFQADSAYAYIAQQLAFGPRVPNTASHQKAAEWLANELKRHGAKVTIQNATLTAYDRTSLQAKNIIGSFNVEKPNRILLMAHWDSRPFADHDPDASNYRKPIPAANDGASGVGVLLEIARLIGEKLPNKGIDIFFTDAEDYGTPSFERTQGEDNSWALGTQYWARRPHQPGYKAQYAILLDMVGAKNATFFKEGFSKHYASFLVDKVWNVAQKLGHGNYFIQKDGGYINDDHYYVNTMAKIPAIDIIHLDPQSETGFYPYWHTMADDMDKIDKNTLKAVGETVTYILYND